MNSRSNKGSSQKEELEAAARNPFAIKSVIEEQLDDAPELDEMFYEVWGWFLKLHSRRSSSGFGVNPISYQEIESFFRLQAYFPHSWEVDIIHLFDDVAMQHYANEAKKEQKKTK